MSAVLLRHASAGDRDDWDGDDRLRPLDERGRLESQALVTLLLPLGVRRIVSSPYVRCVQTVEPLARELGVEVEHDDHLAEGAGDGAASLLSEDGVVACTHGDVIEGVLGYVLKKGAAAVLEPDGDVRLRVVSVIRRPRVT
jgi:broad specificity phosphatase PhoE